MDRITRLRIFILTAETLSFTRSAAALDLARSSVTKAITDLETELGTRLLDRTTRAVSLTVEGAMYLERARDLLVAYDDVHTMFGNDAAQARGRVRASVPSRLGRRVVVPSLPTFFERYPDLQLELRVSHRQDDLVRAGLDCMLLVGTIPDSEFVARKLSSAPLITCASPAYIDRFGTPSNLSDLKSHVAVGYTQPFTSELWAFSGAIKGQPPIRLRTLVTATNADMYIASCKAGLGLAQIPLFDVVDELSAGTLVQVLPDIPAGTIPLSILYAHRRNLSPRVEAFVKWLSVLIRDATLSDMAQEDVSRIKAAAAKS